jgi:hypothetical protein
MIMREFLRSSECAQTLSASASGRHTILLAAHRAGCAATKKVCLARGDEERTLSRS